MDIKFYDKIVVDNFILFQSNDLTEPVLGELTNVEELEQFQQDPKYLYRYCHNLSMHICIEQVVLEDMIDPILSAENGECNVWWVEQNLYKPLAEQYDIFCTRDWERIVDEAMICYVHKHHNKRRHAYNDTGYPRKLLTKEIYYERAEKKKKKASVNKKKRDEFTTGSLKEQKVILSALVDLLNDGLEELGLSFKLLKKDYNKLPNNIIMLRTAYRKMKYLEFPDTEMGKCCEMLYARPSIIKTKYKGKTV